jgi:hypothetical protein
MGFSTSMRDFAIMEMNLRDAKKSRQDKKRGKKELPALELLQADFRALEARCTVQSQVIMLLGEQIGKLQERLDNIQGTRP